MKFPLRERPFADARLSERQCDRYKYLTKELVASTLNDYKRFINDDGRGMDANYWRPLKTRDDVTVYRQTSRARREQQQQEGALWPLPKLVAVGTITGSVEDVMYGISAANTASMVIKNSYIHDDVVDCAVIDCVHGPTAKDPFRFFGLKWKVLRIPHTITAVVWPRDLVYVESTGMKTLDDGSRVGFHVTHSIDHPDCPYLTSQSIIRARHSNCYIFRQVQAGVVDVYMTSCVNAGGSPPQSIALSTASNLLVSMTKAVYSAQYKKTTWLLRHATVKKADDRENALKARYGRPTCCGCEKPFKSFRYANHCNLCASLVCAKCFVRRKLSLCDKDNELIYRDAGLCTGCVLFIAAENASRIASNELAREETATSERGHRHTRRSRARTIQSARSAPRVEASPRLDLGTPIENRSHWSPANRSYDRKHSFSRQSSTGSTRSSVSHDENLTPKAMMMQMQQLCMTAEATYRITSFHSLHMPKTPTTTTTIQPRRF